MFKNGDIVICIDNSITNSKEKVNLTIGKKYKIIKSTSSYNGYFLRVINDIGEQFGYHEYRFKKDFRKEKLENILNENIL